MNFSNDHNSESKVFKNTTVPKEFSDQLRKTSLLSIFMIIGIHSYNLTYLDATASPAISSWTQWIQEWISNWLFRIGTPTFMVISGYLFFWSFLPTLQSYKSKLVKRVRNLAIPFLLWSSLGMAGYSILQSFHATRSFFSQPYLYELSWKELIHVWIMDPIPYQIWFLRDLIVMCLVSPAIYMLLKSRFALLFLGAGFSIWFFNLQEIGVNNKTSSFYLLGAWLAIQRKGQAFPDFRKRFQSKHGLAWGMGLWIFLSMLGATIRIKEGSVIEPLYKIQILCGMNVLWYGYVFWSQFLNFKWVEHVKVMTFFIFACHEPLTRFVCKGFLKLFPEENGWVLLVYILTMTISFTVCSLLGIILKRRLPGIYAPLSGWRF